MSFELQFSSKARSSLFWKEVWGILCLESQVIMSGFRVLLPGVQPVELNVTMSHLPSSLNLAVCSCKLTLLSSQKLEFKQCLWSNRKICRQYYSVTKVSDFLRKPGGFQWSALAWGDLEPSYAYVKFYRLSIVSIDGKQHLSEIVFSALVGFSL